MKRLLLLLTSVLLLSPAFAQRQMEHLNRGLVAVKTSQGVFLSWRVLGEEWIGVSYNLYKNGSKINSEPISTSSNYLDQSGSTSDKYSVSAIVNGNEKPKCPQVSVWSQQYFDIPINRPAGGTTPDGKSYTYSANDASVGDLDGDGQLEIILKWDPSNSKDNSQSGYTGNVILDAYKMDGTQLWRINMGHNIRAGAHYTQFMVYDFDGDGKAEVACKTADGTVDGEGTVIGDPNADYRNSAGYILSGPEYLTMFNGETGKAMATVNYIPPRGSVSSWGDSYGNRVDRFLAGVAYFDGEHPTLLMCRGYYTRTVLAAWDWNGTQFSSRWVFDTNSSAALRAYETQGDHSLSIADVDNDGKDEVIYGAMTIDDDGTGLYTTGLKHGDALHVSDLDPDHPGLEVFSPHEDDGNGVTFREAATGKVLWQYPKPGVDVGRGVAANILDNPRGAECWGASGLGTYDDKGNYIGSYHVSMNFRIFWDGDVLEELLDGTRITKVDQTILQAYNVHSNNGTKSTPSLSADLFGDWREEVIWPTSDNTRLRVYTTTDLTNERLYTLLHDSQYRVAVAWQNTAYNQPPHPSFYLEKNMALPVPEVFQGLKWKGQSGQNQWSAPNNFVNKKGKPATYADGDTIVFSFDGEHNDAVELTSDVAPGLVVFGSPDDYTINGAGVFTGQMNLFKCQKGSLTLEGNQTYSGRTMVTDGALIVNGTLENSTAYVSGGCWGGKNSTSDKGGRIGGTGILKAGLVLQNRGALLPGMDEADTLFIQNNLDEQEYSVNYFDLSSKADSANDMVAIDGDLTVAQKVALKINLTDGKMDTSAYTLFTYTGAFNGSIDNFEVAGLEGVYYQISTEDGKIILKRPQTRKPARLKWSGSTNSIWDLGNTKNWKLAGQDEIFLPQDSVLFDDTGAAQPNVSVFGLINISSIDIDASINYKLVGTGTISGEGGILKKGTGRMAVKTQNSFTGSTVIEDGTLSIDKLVNGDVASNLGAAGNTPDKLILNGGKLEITGSTSLTNKGLTLGDNGGTISVTGGGTTQTIEGKITGNGDLAKDGDGTLAIKNVNDFKGGTTINKGTIHLLSDEATESGLGTGPISIIDGTLIQNDSRNSYNSSALQINIPEDGNATYVLDGRIADNDKLTGSGNLNLQVNYVRSELDGNWSGFSGHINVMTDNDGGDFRVNNSYGYENASVNFNDYVYAYHLNSDTVKLGELSGSGHANMVKGIWEVGALNTNSEFQGILQGDQLIKVGTGRLILSGNRNTYQGGTKLEQGKLWVQNASGSATGTGPVMVASNCVLGGGGRISGAVTVNSGAYVSPGEFIGTLTLESSLQMAANSLLAIELSNTDGTCDKLKVNSLQLNDVRLIMTNTSAEAYKNGDQFQIIDASSIDGKFASIIPTNPADGLYWDTSELYSKGIIKVTDVQTASLDITQSNGLKMYPNPTSGKVTIEWNNAQQKVQKISVFTNNGTKIKEINPSGFEQYQLDLSAHPKGMYIIQLVTKEQSYTEKIFVK